MNKNTKTTILLYEKDMDCVKQFSEIIQRSNTNFSILKQFSKIDKVLEHIPKFLPDVLMINVGPKTKEKIEAIKKVQKNSPFTAILAYSNFYNQELLFECISNGATGFLTKDCSGEEAIEALKKVVKTSTNNRLKAEKSTDRISKNRGITHFGLSMRQKQVMQGLAQGNSYKIIASDLGISPHTVNSHIRKIYSILGAKSAIEAVSIYYEKSGKTVPNG